MGLLLLERELLLHHLGISVRTKYLSVDANALDSAAFRQWDLYPSRLLAHFDFFYKQWRSGKKIPVTQKTHQRIITAMGKGKNVTELEPAVLTIDLPPGIHGWKFAHGVSYPNIYLQIFIDWVLVVELEENS